MGETSVQHPSGNYIQVCWTPDSSSLVTLDISFEHCRIPGVKSWVPRKSGSIYRIPKLSGRTPEVQARIPRDTGSIPSTTLGLLGCLEHLQDS